jgi:paraquat-inducible protein B
MKRAHPALIGAFMLGALALAVLAVVLFGSGKFFTETLPCVLYFDGAVQGLQIGASVNFRGVKVGTVKAIRIQYNSYNQEVRIPVFIEFPLALQGALEVHGNASGDLRTGLVALIERGLRAQLQIESLVTGLLFVQLDFHPDAPAQQATVDPVTAMLEIPTVPTALEAATQTFRKALEKLAQLPLEQMVLDLSDTLHSIRELMGSPELKEAIHHVNVTFVHTQQLVRRLDEEAGRIAGSTNTTLDSVGKLARHAEQLVQRLDQEVGRIATSTTASLGSVGKLAQHTDTQLASLLGGLQETVGTTRATLTQMQTTLVGVQQFLAPNSPVGYELVTTLRELAEAARSLRQLTDYLERHPNAVVFGRNKTGGK